MTSLFRVCGVITGIVALAVSAAAREGAHVHQELVDKLTVEEQLIKDLRWRNIGNANQRGRVSAIDALDEDFRYVVAGTASGGVFKSVNAGTTWEPIFEKYGSASIGDVAIFEGNPDIIWVGTGEECGRNTSAWGDGVYKSTDGGKSFEKMGLGNTYTIGSVVTHPTDPDIVYVAALGNIWGPSERGFFKSTDGGKTWVKLTNGLPDDYDNTGAVEAIMHPTDPNTLFVAFWERHRTSYRLDSGGPNGGIFTTTDGGQSFKKLTKGLPEGDSGKIGLAISRSNPDVLMTHYEHGFQPEPEDPDYEDMTKLGSGIYRSEDGGESWMYMNRYWSRPFYYQHISIDPFDDKKIYSYTGRFQYSEDGGKTLTLMSRSVGHCWHALWLDPHNKGRFYVGSDGGLELTHDGGDNYVTYKNINATQYYMVGVDMRDPYYVCGGLQDAGSSCGPSLTRAEAIYTNDWYNIQGGDGFHVQIDPTDWRTIYTERDPRGIGGEVHRTDAYTRQGILIRPEKGGSIVNYDEYITPEMEALQLEKGWGPPPEPGETQQGGGQEGRMGAFRWNWSSALILSPHNSRTLYLGANHLFKSVDRGDTWSILGPDLSKNEYEKTIRESGGLTPDYFFGGGAEYHGTIVTIAESPVMPGVIWVGTDDGNVQLTRSGGRDWTNVGDAMPGLPAPDFYVSRVRGSYHDAATGYATIDGHRSANFEPWVFKTTDYGRTWKNISSNLPRHHPVYVLHEDPKNPNLLFVGTEFAIFYSINGGESWTRLNNNLPTVAIHDLVIHPRENDLIAGTHGRGIWILDDISALQRATPEVLSSEAHLFDVRRAIQWLEIEPQGTGGSLAFHGENPTKNVIIHYYTRSGVSSDVTFEIAGVLRERKRTYTVSAEPGISRLEWDLRYDPTPEQVRAFEEQMERARRRGSGRRFGPQEAEGDRVEPGQYVVTMTVNGKRYTKRITVRADPMLAEVTAAGPSDGGSR